MVADLDTDVVDATRARHTMLADHRDDLGTGSARKSVSSGRKAPDPGCLVDIRTLDEAAVADDGVMREFYDLTRRAELLRP